MEANVRLVRDFDGASERDVRLDEDAVDAQSQASCVVTESATLYEAHPLVPGTLE